MNKMIFSSLLLVFCQVQLHAQFMVDTLDAVEIINSRINKKPSFSTFTSKLSGSGSHFGYNTNEKDTSIKERILPNAIQVYNIKGVKVRLDSMLFKSTAFDTSKTTVIFNVYAENKLFSSAKVKLTNRKGRVSTLQFYSPIFLPADTSYIGFTIITKDNFPFTFYTNTKVEGYLYSYNKERDAFKLLHYNDMPSLTCPQIKLYYTLME